MDAALSVIFGLHSVTSVSLTLLNKQLTAEIPFPWTIVLLQCLASVPVTLLANVQFRQIKAIKLSHFPGAMLISTLFVLCLTSSLVGLSRVHIPMVVVGKNLGPFCTALLEALILKAPLNPRTLGSLLLGVVGSTFYAMGDANSEGVGLVGLNALLVALTSVSEKHVVRTLDQAALGFSLYRRNILAIPLLLATICAGDWDAHVQSVRCPGTCRKRVAKAWRTSVMQHLHSKLRAVLAGSHLGWVCAASGREGLEEEVP
ncbi:unnamed protein product [Effrenium voratum]|nr:unnamed protein product [Effrenium voratum]